MKHTSRGFSLVEILVTVTIIAVLTAVGVVSYSSVNKRSRDAKRKSDLEQIRSALEMYRVDTGNYPCNNTPLSPTYVQGWVSYPYASPRVSLKSVLEPDYMTTVPLDPKVTNANLGYFTVVSGNYFGYMYGAYSCTSTSRGYALWAQLESPSAADLATEGQGSINTYNDNYGMNYKVSNP